MRLSQVYDAREHRKRHGVVNDLAVSVEYSLQIFPDSSLDRNLLKQPDVAVETVLVIAVILPEDGDESEAGKANPDNVIRDGWPYNYVAAIEAEMKGGKHLIIPSDIFVLTLLRAKNIPYILCYPERSAKEEYRRRFTKRGNTQEFIDIFIGRWDRFIDSFEQDDYGKHLVLEPAAYLSDVFGNEKRL